MQDIAILGAGGFGRELACIIRAINSVTPTYNLIGFFDFSVPVGTDLGYGKVLGDFAEYNSWATPLCFIIGVASTGKLYKIPNDITNPNIIFPNLIAPNVLFFDQESCKMGKGNIFTFNCRISCNVKIGNFNTFNGGISLGHDVKIGNYNMLQPETRISGDTTVGDSNFFGVRSTVIQSIKIGNNVRIGAGSVVMRNTKENKLYMGNPAKIVDF
ncbi:MAG: acetyltransferase [Salinivirgaceae bacterium]|nr:acetyltransferase [Salinivirgaceae bacterium]MDD4748151.1 acetyltransferase [Salinivirgaceae bacterium]